MPDNAPIHSSIHRQCHLIALGVGQHAELLCWEGRIRLGQVEILGFLDVEVHTHRVVHGQHR